MEAFWVPNILKDKVPEHKAIEKQIFKIYLRKKAWVLAIFKKARCLAD